jgi:predicted nucleotidyltransferase
MYAAFVEWLETSNPDDSNEKEFLDKSTYALIYQKRFPHLQTAISKYYFEYNVTKCLKSKLNGRIIMDVLGTDDGRTVGQIMSEIKKKYTTMELIGKTESEIRVIIGDAAAYLAYSTHLMLQ